MKSIFKKLLATAMMACMCVCMCQDVVSAVAYSTSLDTLTVFNDGYRRGGTKSVNKKYLDDPAIINPENGDWSYRTTLTVSVYRKDTSIRCTDGTTIVNDMAFSKKYYTGTASTSLKVYYYLSGIMYPTSSASYFIFKYILTP